MFRIRCPYCGVRDLDEFHFGGEASVARPENPDQCSDKEWAEYLFYRNNVRGQQLERWHHSYGCGRWFLARRDTLNHEVLATYTMDELDHD